MKLKRLMTATVCAASLAGAVGASPAAADGRYNACDKVQDHVWCSGAGSTVVGTCPSGFLLVPSVEFDLADANGDGFLCTSKHRGTIDDTLTSAPL